MNIYELEKLATPGPIHVQKHGYGQFSLQNGPSHAPVVKIAWLQDWMPNGVETTFANAVMLRHCRNNFMLALELLYKALPYVQFYDDKDHPEAVEKSKYVCDELQNGIAELEEVK